MCARVVGYLLRKVTRATWHCYYS